MAEEHDSWLEGLGVKVGTLVENATAKLEHTFSAESDDGVSVEPDSAVGSPAEAQTSRETTPESNRYPATLQKSEKLITQVKQYGFSEGIHATSADAEDRADVKEIWCSGVSNWALEEAGVNIDQKYKYKSEDGKKVSIRDIVEGNYKTFAPPPELQKLPTAKDYPDAKELEAKVKEVKEANKAIEKAACVAAYKQPGLFGKSAADDDPRVKGAPGAFVIAGIGKEIVDLKDVKPGDFVQTRVVSAPDGHAYQIEACECLGEALIGPSRSPQLLEEVGGERIEASDGIWYGEVRFRIDGNTDPAYVGFHVVLKTDVLEANVASMMEDKKDKKKGGVQIRHGNEFQDPAKKGSKRTYVGRLNSSVWTGYSRMKPTLKRPGN